VSIAALLKGAESYLRDRFGDAEGKRFGLQFECQPPPNCGQFYTGLDFGGLDNTPDQEALSVDEYYTLLAVCTWRFNYAPADRRAREAVLADERDRLYATANQVAAQLWTNGGWDLLNVVNNFIDGYNVTTNGFDEPFKTYSVGAIQSRGPEWVHAAAAAAAPSVYSVSLRFWGARRTRLLGAIT
jgi:hypothetical protein